MNISRIKKEELIAMYSNLLRLMKIYKKENNELKEKTKNFDKYKNSYIYYKKEANYYKQQYYISVDQIIDLKNRLNVSNKELYNLRDKGGRNEKSRIKRI